MPNRGEGIVSRKPRPKSAHDFLGLLYCFIVLLSICVVSCPYVIYYPTVIARYTMPVCAESVVKPQANKQLLLLLLLLLPPVHHHYFWFLFNQPIFPEIASGYACSPNLWDCWCEILYTTDALPVAELTVSQHCNCNSGMDRRLRQTLRPLPKWVTLLKF